MSDVLKDLMSEEETAAEVGKTVRTLRQWRKRGVGPPYVRIGRTVKYRRPALVEHYRQREIVPVHERQARSR
jgi:hypothetical protein